MINIDALIEDADWPKRTPDRMADLQAGTRILGGPGSGNFGHAGRPGQVGGSASGFSDREDQIEEVASRALDPDEVREWLHEVITKNEAEAKRDPLRKKVLNLLAKEGGIGMVYLPDPDLALLGEQGRAWSKVTRVMALGEQSQCHRNVSRLFLRGRVDAIVTGYAMPSDDRVWRQHTWGIKGGRIVETTYKYEKYFGVELPAAKAAKFSKANK